MAIVLGPDRYGKAETRLVRVTRAGETHHLTDLNVSIALAGDLAEAHHTADNSGVLPTDTMKNTVYATGDWSASFAGACAALVAAFVNTYSDSLQQTLMAMGTRVLETRPEIAEVRLTLPNMHHYLADLAPFGLANDNEVVIAGDRPYGLIEGTVTRDDAPPATAEWYL